MKVWWVNGKGRSHEDHASTLSDLGVNEVASILDDVPEIWGPAVVQTEDALACSTPSRRAFSPASIERASCGIRGS